MSHWFATVAKLGWVAGQGGTIDLELFRGRWRWWGQSCV